MKATIAVLTLNGEELLDEVLTACLGQKPGFAHEVLVIDSGSTDRTMEILARHPGVRLHQIPNSEFGHGRTRNLAIELSEGSDVVAFLTQDATPQDSGWLAELVAPLEADKRVAATYGRQVPRPQCCPAVKRDVADAFAHGGLAVTDPSFFSNVSSAVRRSVLEGVPFRDLNYAEDRALATDLHHSGWRTAYANKAAVWHSHDLRLVDYFGRMYDEARGLRATGAPPASGVFRLAAATVRGTVKDWGFIVADSDYRTVEKAGWMVKTPLYNVARRLGIRLASSHRLPAWAELAVSLEARRRQAAG